jgi:putative membrane protein
MSIHRLLRATAGITVALAAAPMVVLHAQTPQDSAMHRTFGVPTKTPTPGAPTTSAPTTSAQVRTQALADTAFVREAGTGNVLEVRLGTLAAQKTSNAAVKQFADRMVTDHTTMGNQWAALISNDRLPVKVGLDAAQQQSVSRLEGLSGAEFDRAYMNTMVQDHQQDVATFQRLGLTAQSADVRQLATSGLATIQQHLSMARQVASQVRSTAVVTNPAPPAPAPGGNVVNRQGGVSKELRGDEQYVNDVSEGHIMEVRLAEMARRKARDPKVKQFAERMFTDFTKWQDRWTDLATASGTPNPHLGQWHHEQVDRLDKAPGGRFDRVYLNIVTEHLESMVPSFQKEGRAAHSAKVRNLVDDELPSLEDHLARAHGLSRESHAEAKDSRRDRSLSNNR